MAQPPLTIVKSEPLAPAAGAPATSPPDGAPWPERYPRLAGGTKAVLNALPGVGGVVGAAVAGPETGGLAAVPAIALGVGAGRGLRDLIAEGLGLDAPSSPVAKGARIALDTAESAAAAAILPGLWEAIKTPGRTIREVVEMLPKAIRPAIPPRLANTPARLFERPAWQTWQEHIQPPTGPQAVPAPAQAPISPPPTAASPITVPVVAPVTSQGTAMTSGVALKQANDAFAQAGVKPMLAEASNAAELIKRGRSAVEAVAQVLKNRPTAPVNPVAQFAAKVPGTMTDAQVAAEIAARVGNRSPRRP